MIRIISKQNGFRRCGVAHSTTPSDYPDDRFTDEELAALEAEPMLVLSHVDDAQADPQEIAVSTKDKGKAKDILDRDK